MDTPNRIYIIAAVISLVVGYMSIERWPKALHKLIVLAAAMLTYAFVPLPGTSLTPAVLIVSSGNESGARMIWAILAALMAWRVFPIRGPEITAKPMMVRGMAVIRVTNTGRTSGRFYASSLTPWPDPSKAEPNDLRWDGKDRYVDLEKGQSSEVWIGYTKVAENNLTGETAHVLIMPTFNKAGDDWRSVSYWGGHAEGFPLVRVEDSAKLFIVEIRTTPETYPPWRCKVILDWEGGDRLGILGTELQTTTLERWERRLKMDLGWLRPRT